MRPSLTFHYREIPSWLMGKEGHRQVDKMGGEKGEGLVGGKKSRKVDEVMIRVNRESGVAR